MAVLQVLQYNVRVAASLFARWDGLQRHDKSLGMATLMFVLFFLMLTDNVFKAVAMSMVGDV